MEIRTSYQLKYHVLQLISVLLMSASCSKTPSSINGHWHLVSPKIDYFMTMDINDSLTITELYDLDPYEYYEIPRVYQSKNILPISANEYTTDFSVINDTLYLRQESLIKKYVKGNINNCILTHRYSNSSIEVNLTDDNEALSYEASLPVKCGTNVYVGRPSVGKSQFLDSLASTFPDSTFIQVNDVFIGLSDLPKLSSHAKDVCSPRNPALYFHLDKNVPAAFIQKVLRNIPDSLDLDFYKVVKMNDEDIGIKNL
ncbi:MAG: hypothetical protein RIB63_09420 [Fulvivirga sp.]